MDSTTTETVGEGLRERKKLATKQALAFAAMQLAVERGLENVRVQDITDAVNVSRRTFTNYFASKEEAIASLNSDRAGRAAEALLERPAGEPLADSLAEVFAAQYEAAARMDRTRIVPIQMLVSSPALQGEYLKTLVAAEEPLAMRSPSGPGPTRAATCTRACWRPPSPPRSGPRPGTGWPPAPRAPCRT